MTHADATVPTTETNLLIASNKVDGTRVFDPSGEKIGTVHNFMIERRSGQVAYVVISTGGFLGLGQAYHPLPWDLFAYDEAKAGYAVQITRDQLAGGPSYRPDTAPEFDQGYGRKVDDYYKPISGRTSL